MSQTHATSDQTILVAQGVIVRPKLQGLESSGEFFIFSFLDFPETSLFPLFLSLLALNHKILNFILLNSAICFAKRLKKIVKGFV